MTDDTRFSTLAKIYGTDTDKIDGPKGPRGIHAQQRIRAAYAALFDGRGSKEDADLVFVDLAKFSGYLNTTPPTATDSELRYYEGQRSLFGRIMMFLNPAPTFLHALARTVAEEQHMDGLAAREIT